ncbi:hypothetical protein [Citreimonas sp.]|uniref:hypothetical protein n=1 Tax=Citreimonas sp. TaxID=3036715 RepID=UPI004057DD57
MIRDLAAGLLRPSPASQTPEQALVRGLAHVVLGGLLSFFPWLLVGYLTKEASDLWQGGSAIDSAFDVGFVVLGMLTLPWEPCAAAILLGLGHGAIVYTDRH